MLQKVSYATNGEKFWYVLLSGFWRYHWRCIFNLLDFIVSYLLTLFKAYAHELSTVDPSGNTALYLLKIIPVATVIRWIFHVLQ